MILRLIAEKALGRIEESKADMLRKMKEAAKKTEVPETTADEKDRGTENHS